jgi:hypothetical protein
MTKKLQRRTTAGLGVVAGAGAALLFSLGNAPLAGAAPDDTALTDLMNATTNQFTAFSNNITDNLQASTAGDNAIFTDYLGGLANPDVNNAEALDGLNEVSGQLNTQLGNTNSNDLSGFQDVLGADNDVFGNAGGTGGAGGASAADILAVLQNATDPNVTGALFGGVDGKLSEVAAALAGSSSTDALGDDVTGADVSNVFQDDGITIAPSSLTQADGIAALLNDAAPVSGGGGTTVPSEPALGDVLGAQTDQFTAYSNNLTDNLLAAGNGDAGIYSSFLNGIANGANNGDAFSGLQEVSGQLNDQLSNSNSIDLGGFDSALDQDFTNLGDFSNLGDFGAAF